MPLGSRGVKMCLAYVVPRWICIRVPNLCRLVQWFGIFPYLWFCYPPIPLWVVVGLFFFLARNHPQPARPPARPRARTHAPTRARTRARTHARTHAWDIEGRRSRDLPRTTWITDLPFTLSRKGFTKWGFPCDLYFYASFSSRGNSQIKLPLTTPTSTWHWLFIGQSLV